MFQVEIFILKKNEFDDRDDVGRFFLGFGLLSSKVLFDNPGIRHINIQLLNYFEPGLYKILMFLKISKISDIFDIHQTFDTYHLSLKKRQGKNE